MGEFPGALDIHCYVIFERLICLENTVFKSAFEVLGLKTAAPLMSEFVSRFRKVPAM